MTSPGHTGTVASAQRRKRRAWSTNKSGYWNRVRIDDQLRIRQELRHRKRIYGRHHHVVAAVRDKHWLADHTQSVVSRVALGPRSERLQLSFDAMLRDRRRDFSDPRLQTL